jgi:predicted Zn-dependent protease
MTEGLDIIERVLDLVGDRAAAEAYIDTGTTSLTRFANSFIHQNVAEDVSQVSLRVSLDGRVASSTTTDASPDALAAFVDATLEAAKQQHVDKDWPGFGGAARYPTVEHWDEETASAEPVERARAVKDFIAAGEGLLGAGFCQTEARHHAYGNTEGRVARGRFTTAVLDGIHQTSRSAGSGHAAGVSLGSIDATGVGALAAQRARDNIDPFDTKPGEYEVVLSPECVATIAVFLDVYGFNAKVAQEGMSFAEVGSQQFDRSVQIWDDATDPRALYVPFDIEGTPKGRLELVRDGITVGMLHNRRTAAKEGVESTGAAAQGAEAFGPFAWNLFIGAGDASVDALVSEVDRGIFVSTFNYCRVLDPKSLVVTGLTRNGTFMIENGQITDPVTNLRFTQSFVKALGDGQVLGIADDARFADSEFGPTFVHAPSMRLASWKFTGGADG